MRSTWTELTDRVGEGVHNLSQWTRGSIDSISQTANRTREAIENTTHWGRDTIDSTRHFFSTFSPDQIDEIIATWVVHHPILALIGVAVGIFLLMSLLQAIGRGIANAWVALFKISYSVGKMAISMGKEAKHGEPGGEKVRTPGEHFGPLKSYQPRTNTVTARVRNPKRKKRTITVGAVPPCLPPCQRRGGDSNSRKL